MLNRVMQVQLMPLWQWH